VRWTTYGRPGERGANGHGRAEHGASIAVDEIHNSKIHSRETDRSKTDDSNSNRHDNGTGQGRQLPSGGGTAWMSAG
jgi:hypothetical protein